MRQRSVVFLFLLLAGCASSASSPSPSSSAARAAPASQPNPPSTRSQREPLSKQLARVAEQVHGKRFSTLLHFEDPSDALFVSAAPSAPRLDRLEPNTGESSLLLRPGTRRITLKLSSLIAGRSFPGEWTLLGLHLRSDVATAITLSCADDGKLLASRTVALPAGAWTPALLDVSAFPAKPDGGTTLEIQLVSTGGTIRIDDVMLIDNRETLLDASPDGWTVRRAGLRITCERKLRFSFSVMTRDGLPQGWEIEEVNALRARFTSSGATKSLTVYADGRSTWDGTYKPLSADVRDDHAFAAAHASPAELAVPGEMGRVDRNTPGDANNDGYNEQLGAYQLQAAGGRIELTLTPRVTAVPRPVLQIAGLPQGKALITMEGRLIERWARLNDGQLLLELPARITRPTLVSIRIQ